MTCLTSSHRVSMWPEDRRSRRRRTQLLLDSVGLVEGQKMRSSAWKSSQWRGWSWVSHSGQAAEGELKVALAALQARMMSVKRWVNSLESLGRTRSRMPDRQLAGRGAILVWMNWRPVVQASGSGDLRLDEINLWQMSELVQVRVWEWCLRKWSRRPRADLYMVAGHDGHG